VQTPVGLDDLSDLFSLFLSEKPQRRIILSTVRHRPGRAASDFSLIADVTPTDFLALDGPRRKFPIGELQPVPAEF